MPYMPMYSNELVPDNEYGALDNETLLAIIKKRAKEEAPAAVSSAVAIDEPPAEPKPTPAQATSSSVAVVPLGPKKIIGYKEWTNPTNGASYSVPIYSDGTDGLSDWTGGYTVPNNFQLVQRSSNAGGGSSTGSQQPNNQSSSSTQASTQTQAQVTVPTVQPTPSIPLSTSLIPVTPVQPPIKTAPIDTVLFNDEAFAPEVMTDLIFENIGGHEILNIARNDTINGQNITYQPIKNLTAIQQQYNPNNIVALQNTSDKYFANFAIKLDTKLPEEGAGPDGAYVFIEEDTGDLVVELVDLQPDEQVEVQITLSGTIYESEFNES